MTIDAKTILSKASTRASATLADAAKKAQQAAMFDEIVEVLRHNRAFNMKDLAGLRKNATFRKFIDTVPIIDFCHEVTVRLARNPQVGLQVVAKPATAFVAPPGKKVEDGGDFQNAMISLFQQNPGKHSLESLIRLTDVNPGFQGIRNTPMIKKILEILVEKNLVAKTGRYPHERWALAAK